MKAVVFLSMFLISFAFVGQTKPPENPFIIQISGKAVDEVSLIEIPYVTVWNRTINKNIWRTL